MLVNHHRGLDVVLFYALLLLILSVAVYGFMAPGVQRIFNRYVPPVLAFCLMLQTWLGFDAPGLLRPGLRYLIRSGDEAVYRWPRPGRPMRDAELRFGQVERVETNAAVPEDYAGAVPGSAKIDVAVIRAGAEEIRVPVTFVLLR